jgi:alkylated DNA nucleotide flippase Atl1
MKKNYSKQLHNNEGLPKIIELNQIEQTKWGGKFMVIPRPIDVYECIKNIRKGNIVTTKQIREFLAKKYNADVACAWSTSVFINLSANASVQMQDFDMPFWRVLKSDGSTNSKFPDSPNKQVAMLIKEGFNVQNVGSKFFVKDYEMFLYRLR